MPEPQRPPARFDLAQQKGAGESPHTRPDAPYQMQQQRQRRGCQKPKSGWMCPGHGYKSLDNDARLKPHLFHHIGDQLLQLFADLIHDLWGFAFPAHHKLRRRVGCAD